MLKPIDITPEQFGIPKAHPPDLHGGEVHESVEIAVRILEGEKGPRRDIVLFNAAAAVYVGGRAQTIEEGLKIAAQSIDSGAARTCLDKLIEVSHRKG